MKAQDLMEMAKGFEGIVESIKSGDATIEDFREAIDEMGEKISEQIKVTVDILKKENPTGQDKVMKLALLAQIEEESKDYDYKEHKKLVLTVLEMVKELDTEVQADLFLPFMIKIFDDVNELLEASNPEMAKAVRKGLKKFRKLQKSHQKEGK